MVLTEALENFLNDYPDIKAEQFFQEKIHKGNTSFDLVNLLNLAETIPISHNFIQLKAYMAKICFNNTLLEN